MWDKELGRDFNPRGYGVQMKKGSCKCVKGGRKLCRGLNGKVKFKSGKCRRKGR
jgi:hypothetical protein